MAYPKKPTALKIIQGTVRKDRLNPSEPEPEISIPTCPKHLSKGARAEWQRITPELEKLGLLSQIDRAALAGYCQLWARWVEAEENIQQSGEVLTTPNGSLQVSPWVSIARNSLAEMRKFLTEFGLTPASRTKVTAKPTKNKTSRWE